MERQTVSIPECAQALGISLGGAYSAARRNELPVPVIRVGRRYLVPRAALERILANGTPHPATAPAGPGEAA